MNARNDAVGKKSEPADAPRKGVNTRITDELRSKLERSAAQSNRTVGSDIEYRLNASFKLDFANSSGISALLNNRAATDLISNFGAVIDGVIKACSDRGFSEIETRKALRSALMVVISRHLWLGEALTAPNTSGRSEVKDLPPGLLGQRWAAEHVLWDSAWNDRPVVDDTYEGRVANHWTGDGSKIELGEPPKPRPHRRPAKDLSLAEIEADPRFESPEKLHLYKNRE